MELLKKRNCRLVRKVRDWRDAVRVSVIPLEEEGAVEPRYKEEIIRNVEEMGPYIVLAPQVAMPHARPEQGAKQTQIALTLLEEPVSFDEDKEPVRLLIALAAADNNSHLDALMQISEVLQDDDKMEGILQAADADALYEFFA